MTVPYVVCVAVLFGVGLWLHRRGWTLFDSKQERRPTLIEEQVPPENPRDAFRQRYQNMTLAERTKRDERIAAAVVKRWRKKGLP